MQLTWLTGAPVRAGFGSPARLRARRPRLIRHAADAGRWAATQGQNMMTHARESLILQTEFLSMGFQYLVLGRAAAIEEFMPVAGNVLHHAVEMFLKAALADRVSVSELKSIGHKLPILWQRCQIVLEEPEATRARAAIDKLDRFEAIRYPDGYLTRGSTISIRLSNASAPPFGANSATTYDIVLEDVDELVAIIYRELHLNKEFFTQKRSSNVLQYLNRENKYPF